LKTIIALILLMFILAGCAPQTGIPTGSLWASVEGGQINSQQAGEEFYFTVPTDQGMIDRTAPPIKIRLFGTVTSGSLTFVLRDPQGQTAWDSGLIGPGDFDISTTVYPEQVGDYQLGLVYAAVTQASYNLSWHAFEIRPAIFISGAGMLLVSLGFILYHIRRRLS